MIASEGGSNNLVETAFELKKAVEILKQKPDASLMGSDDAFVFCSAMFLWTGHFKEVISAPDYNLPKFKYQYTLKEWSNRFKTGMYFE
jgi:hypothetical protein